MVKIYQNLHKTMHSSRMRTARSLAISRSIGGGAHTPPPCDARPPPRGQNS